MRESSLAPPLRSPRRLTLLAVALLLGLLLAPLSTSSAQAQDDDVTVTVNVLVPGVGDDPDEVQPGVTVILSDESEVEIERQQTDADGQVVFPAAPQTAYVVTIDDSTLAEGLARPDTYPVTLSLNSGSATRPMRLQRLDASGEIVAAQDGRTLSQKLGLIPQLTLDGIKFGAIIAITAIGLSLIFGTTGLVNFAHGELVTLGAVTAWFFNASGAGPGFSIYLAAVIATLVGAFAGQSIERGIWAPLRKRGVGLISMLVISIGLSFIIRSVIQIYYGGDTRPFVGIPEQNLVKFAGVEMVPRDIVIIVLSFSVLIGVGLMLQRTKIGKALRAVADNKDLAESSGIDVERVIRFVWFLGGGLTAFGGVLLGAAEKGINFNMGFNLLMLMFAGMILGGIGTAYGAMLGSMVVGIVSLVSTAFFSPDLKFVWGLVILIIVLLIKPQGILGKAERFG